MPKTNFCRGRRSLLPQVLVKEGNLNIILNVFLGCIINCRKTYYYYHISHKDDYYFIPRILYRSIRYSLLLLSSFSNLFFECFICSLFNNVAQLRSDNRRHFINTSCSATLVPVPSLDKKEGDGKSLCCYKLS